MVITGLVVSSMVNVAVDSEALPHSSMAMNVTVTEPVSPQSSLKDMLLSQPGKRKRPRLTPLSKFWL